MKSRLNKHIVYEQYDTIFGDDDDTSLDLYEAPIKNIRISFTVGNAKNDFIQYGVIYFPIYAVKDIDGDGNYIFDYIGVYEINAGDIVSKDIYDSDGSVNIEKLDEPLLFDGVNVMFLQQYKVGDDVDEITAKIDKLDLKDEEDGEDDDIELEIEEAGEDEEDGEDDEEKDGEDDEEKDDELKVDDESKLLGLMDYISREIVEYDDDDPNTYIPKTEPQTKQQAKNERNEYKKSKATNWVQKYMKNLNYDITDNEGGGDCFFAVVRDAFASINKRISVAQLREIVAMKMTQEQFEYYKGLYDMIKSIDNDAQEQLRIIARRIQHIRKEYNKLSTTTEDTHQKKILRDELSELKLESQEHKATIEQNSELLEHLGYLETIHDLDEMRSYMRTRHYWADENAISVIEKELNVKMIIFSREEFRSGSLHTIVQCGSVTDPEIEERKVFKPKYYIPTEFLGYHYTTISYKNKKIFTYEDIPYDMKRKLALRCLEGLGGIYKFIPKFIHFYESFKNIPGRSKSEIFYATDETDTDDKPDVVDDKESHKDETELPVLDTGVIETDVVPQQELYSDEVVFQYYDRSSNKKPGFGPGEKISPKFMAKYNELAKITDWRKKLSNDYMFDIPIVIDELQWATPTHYYQASKYKKSNPELFAKFALNSETELSKDVKLAKIVGRMGKDNASNKKVQKFAPEYYSEIIEIDDDFYDERCKQERYKSLREKYNQITEAKQILLLTKPAMLYEYKQGRERQQSNQLMKVRNEL